MLLKTKTSPHAKTQRARGDTADFAPLHEMLDLSSLRVPAMAARAIPKAAERTQDVIENKEKASRHGANAQRARSGLAGLALVSEMLNASSLPVRARAERAIKNLRNEARMLLKTKEGP